MQNFSKLYECRAAALPRLNRLMEKIDPGFVWSINENPSLTAFLIDRRNSSWGNDPTPAQAMALSAFRQEVMLRGQKDFQFELFGNLICLDGQTGKATQWSFDETNLKWDSKELEMLDFLRLQDYYSQHFGKGAEDARAKRSKEDWERVQDTIGKKPTGPIKEG